MAEKIVYKRVQGIAHLVFIQNSVSIMGHVVFPSDFIEGPQEMMHWSVVGRQSVQTIELHPCCIPGYSRQRNENEEIKSHQFWDLTFYNHQNDKTEEESEFVIQNVLQMEPMNDMVQLSSDFDHLLEHAHHEDDRRFFEFETMQTKTDEQAAQHAAKYLGRRMHVDDQLLVCIGRVQLDIVM